MRSASASSRSRRLGTGPAAARRRITCASRSLSPLAPQDDVQHLEVGLRLGLEREHLLQAAPRHRVVANHVGVEPRRLAEALRRPRGRLGQTRLARVQLGGRARIAARLPQPRLRAQRRQQGRVRLDGAREIRVRAAQIAARQARAPELPQQHGAGRVVGRRLRQLPAREDRQRPVAGARRLPLQHRERLLGRVRLDHPAQQRQRLGQRLVRAGWPRARARSPPRAAAPPPVAASPLDAASRSSACARSRSRPSFVASVTAASSTAPSPGATSSAARTARHAPSGSPSRQARSSDRPTSGARCPSDRRASSAAACSAPRPTSW